VSILPTLEQGGGFVNWAVFWREFLDIYFLEDVRGNKGTYTFWNKRAETREHVGDLDVRGNKGTYTFWKMFVELKQGNIYV